jgi:heme-degrading monooxygenase HmoA
MFIAMNHFRVAPDRCEEFERGWRERESYLHEVPGYVEFHLLKGPEEDGARLYASHTVWRDEAAFTAWTESEAFHKAHRRAGGAVGLMLGPPRFIGWQAVL